jgi:hypothetical protein
VPGFLSFLGFPLFFSLAAGGEGGAGAGVGVGAGAGAAPSLASSMVTMRGISAVLFGMLLFSGGNIVQFIVHRELARLRDAGSEAEGRREEDDGSGAGASASGAPGSSSAARATEGSADDDVRRRRAVGASAPQGSRGGSGGASAPFLDVDLARTPPASGPVAAGTGTGTGTGTGMGMGTAAVARSTAAKYPLPKGGFFDLAVCPHYTAEIALYLGLLIVQYGCAIVLGNGLGGLGVGMGGGAAARAPFPAHVSLSCGPSDEPFPLLSRLSFPLLVAWVATNLCVTGARTRAWYVSTYPREVRVRYTAAVIPYLL